MYSNFELGTSNLELRTASVAAPVCIRAALLGYGRVGQAVAAVAEQERGRLGASGIEIRCTSALVRDVAKPRLGPSIPLFTDSSTLLAGDADVVVEVLGGVEPARTIVSAALRAGIPVVTANKTLMAHHGPELRRLAEAHRTRLAFDAAVLAGVPFVGSLSRRPLISDVRAFAGILNGTSHFVVTAMARGARFDAALREAVERGYAEPDSSADVEGRDAAEKLAILLQLAGNGLVRPAELTRQSLEALEPDDFAGARQLGGVIKPVAVVSLDPARAGAWVGPALVPKEHAFAHLDGVTNVLQLARRTGEPVTFAGPGAGPEATAVTILDDIAEIVSGGASSGGRPPCSRLRESPLDLSAPPPSGWFLRMVPEGDFPPARVAEFLAAQGTPALQLVAHDKRLYARTVPVGWRGITDTAEACRTLSIATLALPVLEPHDLSASPPLRLFAS